MAQRVVRPLRLTADDYFDLPDDGNRYELIAGELELSPFPGLTIDLGEVWPEWVTSEEG